jgi:hypothetical protein
VAERKDFTGQRFGRYFVVERMPPRPNGPEKRSRSEYKCLCDCGNTRIVSGSSLTTGNTQSCGCKRADELRAQKRLRPFEWLYNLLATTSKRRSLEFSLSYEDFVSLTQKTWCQYCGERVKWKEYSNNRSTEGYGYNLDRKDSFRGYTADNVVACCGTCNQAKNDLSLDEFKEWIVKCYDRLIDNKWPV